MKFLAFPQKKAKRRRSLRKKHPEVKLYQSVFNNSTSMRLLTEHCHLFWNQYGGRRDVAKSFWISSSDEPQCLLEYFAQQCALFHCGENYLGAEYWVQYRTRNRNVGGDPIPSDGLEFHFDKDEIACSLNETWKHPTFSTVTYLGSPNDSWGGAPIVIFRTKSIELPPALKPIKSSSTITPSRAWISFPRPGVHIRFDGNLLHGVPYELNTFPTTSAGETTCYHRLSLAVNLWVKEKPIGLKRIDEKIFNTSPTSTSGSVLCFTQSIKNLKLKPVAVQQQDDDNTETDDNLYYLKEHLEGDTGPIPIKCLQNEYHKICQKESNYGHHYNGIVIKYGRSDEGKKRNREESSSS